MFLLCLGVAVVLIVWPVLISAWGHWYERDAIVHLQSRAFLDGRLALLPGPYGTEHDWNWGPSGVHNNWGLGVPLLYLPFEIIARLLGAPGVPDRLLLLAFVATTVILLCRGLVALSPAATQTGGVWLAAAAAAAFLCLAPPFFLLIESRFAIYELIIVYGCLLQLVVLSQLLMLRARPTLSRYLVVAIVVGFGCLIRPIGILTGGMSFALAMFFAYRARLGVPRVALGALIAILGLGLTLFLNHCRYADMFEFGNRYGWSIPIVNRHTAFDPPFVHDSFLVRLREVWGALFLGPESPSLLTPRIWGSASERYREHYFRSFDVTVAAAYLTAVGVGLSLLFTKGEGWSRTVLADRRVGVLLLWSVVLFAVLGWCYANYLALTSRYLAEFYPAIFAGILALFLALYRFSASRSWGRAGVIVVAACLVVWWWGGRQDTFWYMHRTGVSADALARRIEAVDASRAYPPVAYRSLRCPSNDWPRYGIPKNRTGWGRDCSFPDSAQVALPATRCLRLEVGWNATIPTILHESWVRRIRVASILAELALEDIDIDAGQKRARLRYCSERQPAWNLGGLQVFVVAAVPRAPFFLLEIAADHE